MDPSQQSTPESIVDPVPNIDNQENGENGPLNFDNDEMEISTPISAIELDSMAYLKIVMHSSTTSSSSPNGSSMGNSGQLVGVEIDGVLSISNSFSVPSISPSAAGSSSSSSGGNYGSQDSVDSYADTASSLANGGGHQAAQMQYVVGLLRSFRDTNIDHESVGWYSFPPSLASSNITAAGTCPSSILSSSSSKAWMYSQHVIETQFAFQQNISQSVLLIFDGASISADKSGGVSAYRLTEKFMTVYAGSNSGRKLTADSLVKNKFTAVSEDIYEQIPVTVTQSSYSKAFFSTFGSQLTKSSANASSSNVVPSTTRDLDRQLEELTRSIDAFTQEQYKWTRYQQQHSRQLSLIQHHTYKRKMENQRRLAAGEEAVPEEDVAALFRTINEPSRFDGVMGQARILEHCLAVQRLAGDAREKLDLVKSLISSPHQEVEAGK